MANKIFKVVGFSLAGQDTHIFTCDGTFNLSPSECIIINADTVNHNEIVLAARMKVNNTNGNFKTLVTIGNDSGTTVEGVNTSSYATALPATFLYTKFDVYYPSKLQEGQGITPGNNWFNILITLNKSIGSYSFYYTLDNGTVLLNYSGTGNTTRDTAGTLRWLMGAYLPSQNLAVQQPYTLELDLNSVSLTLDGTVHLLKSPDIEIDKKVVLNNAQGENLEPYITTDSALSTESTNPIQNGVVANRLRSILYFDTVN